MHEKKMSEANKEKVLSDHEIIELIRKKYGGFQLNSENSSQPITYVSITHISIEKSNILQKNLGNIFKLLERLKNLKFITIIATAITKLPESIGNLITLERLDLRRNNLISLPDSFGNLTALRHLELSNNQLSVLPDSFGNLKKLESLNLQANNIIYLPESFKNLEKLRSLDIMDNKLRSFSNIPLSIRESKYLLTRQNRHNAPDYILDRIVKMSMDFASPDGNIQLGVIELENEYNFADDTFEFVDMYMDGVRLLEGNLPIKLRYLPYFKKLDKNKTVEYVIDVMDDENIDKLMANINNIDNYDGYQDFYQFYNYYYDNKKEFYEYYAKSPVVLAQQYIQDPNSLTQDERERLAWEGNHRERHILEAKVSPDDPILLEINKRLTLEFPNNKGLKLMK